MGVNLDRVLKEFGNYVVKNAKGNLASGGHNTSGRLSDSIGYKVRDTKITFEFEQYGEFLDKGVNGVRTVKSDTPYSFTTKMPPARSLDKWTVKKGIAPRDKKGRFIPRKSLNWIIARGIFNNGIKRTLFFTKPFEEAQKKYYDKIIGAFFDDNKQKLED